MEIIIPLPANPPANTYKELKGYLKQFELAIHHAQKAVENAEETGIAITEDSHVCFGHPQLDDIEEVKDFGINYYEELQRIDLKINLQ